MNKIPLLLLILAFILLLFAGCGKPSAPVVEAQSASIVELKFTTKFYDALDKKVAFKTDKESLYLAGVVYLNKEIVFTFQPEARFAITNKGLERLKENSNNFELKLDEKNVDVVAILSEKEIEQLRLLKEPENGLSPIALNFVHEQSPMSTYDKNHVKCCCGENPFVDKVCEKILWDAAVRRLDIEDFQKMMAGEYGHKVICAVINSGFACGPCGGLKCPGEKEGCREDIGSETIDDLGDLDDLD